MKKKEKGEEEEEGREKRRRRKVVGAERKQEGEMGSDEIGDLGHTSPQITITNN